MLTFVGLGLHDERSVTVAGRRAIRDADRVFAEFYTSRLVGATLPDLEAFHGVDVEVRGRAGVEDDPEAVLSAAEVGDVVFATAGDAMVSTTHVDLRLRAEARGIETRLVHGPSAATAAAGLTGLQNYRFGKAVTLPFPHAHGGGDVPGSVVDSVAANRDRGLHTLVYLDIEVDPAERRRRGDDRTDDEPAFMTADAAAGLLAGVDGWTDRLGVAVARAGSPDPVVAADALGALADRSFGPPLHLLVLPGDLHHVEADALRTLADAPDALVDAALA
jgi:diphthine synthase